MKQFCTKHHNFFRIMLFSLVLFDIAFLCSGCGALTWLTDAQNILPIVGNMVSLVLTLIATLSGGTILPVDIAATIAAVISKALAGIKDIEAAVAEYKATNPPPVGALQKIEAATQAVIDNLDGFLNDTLGSIVNQALHDKIKSLLTLVLNEVVAFASLLPALHASAGQKLSITVPMTSNEAKAEWNKIVSTSSGDAAVDAALAALPKL
jgi:hypothetical protein